MLAPGTTNFPAGAATEAPYNARSAPNIRLANAIITAVSIATPLRTFWLFFGASGPTIFFTGSTFSFLAISRPCFIPGRPSMLYAFLAAQYLLHG